MTALPPGVAGIILAGLVAAASSSLNSDLNSLSAVITEDYYARFKPGSSDKERLFVSRATVVIGGLAAVGLGTFYLYVETQTVLSIVFTLYAIFSGGLAGLFLLGIATTKTNKKGVYVGIIACILFTGYAILTSTPVPVGGGENKLLLDLGRFNYSQHKYMIGVYSHIVLFVVGYVASFFFNHEKEIKDLTIYAWLKKRRKDKENKMKEIEEYAGN
jgi:SSS family solute:Na+ symporter